MDKETLDRAIRIKKEIEELETEINLLPITTHKRRLREIIGGVLKRNYNKLYVVETYTYNKEVIELDQDDMDCLVNRRLEKINKLKEELSNL